MVQAVCMGRYFEKAHPVNCQLRGTLKCPLMSGKYKDLKKFPCTQGIVVPAVFLTEAKNDQEKAARKYVDTCIL